MAKRLDIGQGTLHTHERKLALPRLANLVLLHLLDPAAGIIWYVRSSSRISIRSNGEKLLLQLNPFLLQHPI